MPKPLLISQKDTGIVNISTEVAIITVYLHININSKSTAEVASYRRYTKHKLFNEFPTLAHLQTIFSAQNAWY